MAEGRGGYRRPTNPAPVSGPGALSRRTDGAQPAMALPDAQYGEQQQFQEAQQGAAMAQKQPIDTSGLTPLDAPTQQPGTPVTDGAEFGPGAGPEALQSMSEVQDERNRLHSYLPVLKSVASRQTSSASFRQLVRQLVSEGTHSI